MIENTLRHFFSKHPASSLLIAYSGGIDSQVLLHSLASLKKQNAINTDIRVCHVDHGLSQNASQWQVFAKEQCKKFDLPLTIIPVNVQATAQQSIEAQARDARYCALKLVGNKGDLIVTGHHSDDQTETFLLALKRGSGLKGLSAMRSEMAFGDQLLVRPLLNISRTEIEAYANLHKLEWIEDESNNDVRFDRNFIRHQISPKLVERWPSINKTIARSAEHCFEAQQLLDELAVEDLYSCQESPYNLSVSHLNKLSEPRLKNLLRYFLSTHHILMPSREQLKQICLQLNADSDKSPVVQLAECCIRRFKGELYLTKIFQDVSAWQQTIDSDFIAHKTPFNLNLPDEIGVLSFSTRSEEGGNEINWQGLIKKPTENQVVTIRFAHDNPICLPQYRQHSRSLKKVLQELSIPPWQRRRSPFIFYDNELVAVAGRFICKGYLAESVEAGFVITFDSEPSL